MEGATVNCPSCKTAWTLGQSVNRPTACPFCGASLADKDEQPDTNTIQGVVRAMILEYGAELYRTENASRLRALLGDLAARFPQELKILNIVIQERAQERLLKADGGTDEEKSSAAAWCVRHLGEEIGMTEARAAEAVNILAAGLGWKPPLGAESEKTAQTSADGTREIVVAADGSGDYAALQEAIDAAAAGGSIRIKPGVYKGSVRLEKPLTIKGVDGSIRARASKDLPVLLLGPDGHLTVTERAAGARISGVVFTQFAENFKNLAEYSEQRDDFDKGSTDERAKALSAWLKLDEKKRPDGYLAHIAGAVEFHDTALLCPMAGLCEISAGGPLFSDCFFGRGLSFGWGDWHTAVHIRNDASPVMLRCSFGGVELCLRDKAGGTYRDCNIAASGGAGIQISDMAGGTYENCDIHDNKWDGICIDGSAKPTIKYCKIYDNGLFGIRISGSATPTIKNCKIYDNGEEDALWPAIAVCDSANPTVRNCEIYGHSCKGIFIHGNASGIYEKCDIHDNEEAGIGISGSATPTIENCKIYNNVKEDKGCVAIAVWDSANPTVRNCEMYGHLGNSIVICDNASGTYGKCDIHDNEGHGIRIAISGSAAPTIENCKIYNNVKEDKRCVAICVCDSANPTVRNCEMHGHFYGILILGDAGGTYEDCNIHDNKVNKVYNYSSGNSV